MDYCYLILDESRSLLNLILMVLTGAKTLVNQNKKDTLLSLSGVENLKLEDAKLILYLFCHHCCRSSEEVNIDDYLKMTGRSMQNKDPIRQSVKRLSALRIIYLDHNSKRQEQTLFKELYLKRGKINYRINSYFETKLKSQGRGHRDQKVKAFLYKDEHYRAFRYNSIRLVVQLDLLYCLDDSNSIDKETLQREKDIILELLEEYFDHRIRPLILWIDQSSKELLKYYTRS